MATIYEEKGYKNRLDYLKGMAEEHDVPFSIVFDLADILGEEEDFDGLITNLEDYH